MKQKKFVLVLVIISIILLLLFLYRKNITIENYSNKVTLYNWWGDDKTSETLFANLFDNTKYDTINMYSIFGDEPNLTKEPNVLNVQFSGESYYNDTSKFDINLIPAEKTSDNIIVFLYAIFHILHTNMDINKLLVKRKLTTMPTKFCLFSVSNGGCKERNDMFNELSKYKKVDSCGKFMNNSDNCPEDHYSKKYFDFISNYKFMICFENKTQPNYFTEKLINAYYNNTIPIYWGCSNIEDYVDMKSILYLPPKYTEADMNQLIEKIAYLDNNDQAYREMFESTFFKNGKLPDEFNVNKIKEKIKNIVG